MVKSEVDGRRGGSRDGIRGAVGRCKLGGGGRGGDEIRSWGEGDDGLNGGEGLADEGLVVGGDAERDVPVRGGEGGEVREEKG